jgi:hypothetical protein
MGSHEADHAEVSPKHAMEDVDWVHEGSRWLCKINGCTNSYAAMWLLHQQFDNKHLPHMEVGKFNHPFICLRGPR